MAVAANAADLLPEQTGLSSPNTAHMNGTTSGRRPLSTAWITDELLEQTRRVWSSYLGRDVSEDEAVEMLTNVRNLTLALLAAMEDGDHRA